MFYRIFAVEYLFGNLTMWPLKRSKPYSIRVNGDSVFVSWNKPLPEWDQQSQDEYLPSLQKAVRSTVDDEVYEIISSGDMWSDQKANDYVKMVVDDLRKQYGLPDSEESVWIGHYHMNMLVIGFDADPQIQYPYYYKGIQLKPTVAEQGAQPDASGAG
jgi:hypothetical protein